MLINRASLEVLKWCSASDLLLHLSQLCRLFATLTNEPEIWYELLESNYSPVSTLSPKQQYRLLAAKYIPVVSATCLHKFFLHSHTWQTINLSTTLRVYRFMCTAFTRDGQVFVTGAPDTADTFQIHPISGLVTYLEPLITHRNSMGLIRYEEDMYTIAGYSGAGYHNSCEIYTPNTGHWRRLPNCINARSAATLASHNKKIYILGGCGAITCEYLDTQAETFHLLPMELPGEYCTIAFCTDTELIAVQELGYYTCNIAKPQDCWEMTTFPFDFGIAFWSDSPVFYYNGAYYIHQNFRSRIIVLKLAEKSYIEFPTHVPALDS